MKFRDGEIVFDTHLEAFWRAHQQSGVLSGLEVVPTDPPSMDVIVKAGSAKVFGTSVSKASDTQISIPAADPSYPRKDFVILKSDGTIEVVSGSPAAVEPSGRTGIYTRRPAPPDIPDDCIILAEIWVPAGASAISSDDITDRRILIKIPAPKLHIASAASQTVTETSKTLKGEISPDSGYTSLVPFVTSLELSNPADSNVYLSAQACLYFHSDLESVIEEFGIGSGSVIAEDIPGMRIAQAFRSGDEIKSVRLYAWCTSAPPSGYEPSVRLKLVAGLQY